MSTITADLQAPSYAFTVPEIDVNMIASQTVTKGEFYCMTAGALVNPQTNTVTGVLLQNGAAPQRRSGCIGIAMNSGVSGDRIVLRIQGFAPVAKINSTAAGGGAAGAIGDPLITFGSGQSLQLEAPLANVNRWVAYLAEPLAAGATGSGVFVNRAVVMMGPNGLGIQGTGA